jgi:hypothetical protein
MSTSTTPNLSTSASIFSTQSQRSVDTSDDKNLRKRISLKNKNV